MPRPDSALRLVVTQLSMLEADDVMSILEGLNVQDRRAVEALLREYTEPPTMTPKPDPVPPPTYDRSKISPWLTEPLDDKKAGSLTSRARQVLRDTAIRLYPATATVPPPPPKLSPIARFASAFSRQREA